MSCGPGLDLSTPLGRGILALLSGLAEEERTRILRQALQGVALLLPRQTRPVTVLDQEGSTSQTLLRLRKRQPAACNSVRRMTL